MTNKVLGLVGLATRAGKVIFGTDACVEGIEKNKIKLIILTNDASERLKNKFIKLCELKNNGVKVIIFGTIDTISSAIGKQNKAVIGIKDINFSNEIIKIINGGEVIG
ncbi:MAG TPA: ribosomal L7Ae/L30e/S12e/Gadd45 family protein [Clostridia bacterium]|nr:ribosomal L7Ae/L30e/S12e/Gadd45 family protein [Clostridia bacterium]